MGSIAAPLLAALCVALAVVVIAAPASFHWASGATVLMVGATIALVAAVQFTYRARQFVVTPEELESWWPDSDKPWRRDMLRSIQRHHRREFKTWAFRARIAYDGGIVLFALGVAALLAPEHVMHASPGQLAPPALAITGAAAELAWMFWPVLRGSKTPDYPTVKPEPQPAD
jgi:hypothetical protein